MVGRNAGEGGRETHHGNLAGGTEGGLLQSLADLHIPPRCFLVSRAPQPSLLLDLVSLGGDVDLYSPAVIPICNYSFE